MIANNSVRTAISFIHLALAIFCWSFFIAFSSTKTDYSFGTIYHDRGFFLMLTLGIIGMTSLIGFLSWQTTYSKISKIVSYVVSLLFLVLYAVFFKQLSKSDAIGAFVFSITPAIFLFLLAFSKIGQIQTNDLEGRNDFLDSDFLIIPNKESTNSSVFWKPNRIVSLSSCIFAVLLFGFLLSISASIWSILIPCIFFVGSAVLWLFPKIGSYFFAVVSGLVGTGVVVALTFTLITKPITETDNSKKSYMIAFICLIAFSIFILCFSLSMLLLSKEAKAEWKPTKNNSPQIQ